MSVADRLEDAAAWIAAGRMDEALGALLEAWRACRAPELASLVDQVGARVESPPIPPDAPGEAGVSWGCYLGSDPGRVDRLLGRELKGTAAEVYQLVSYYPDDPRVAWWLAAVYGDAVHPKDTHAQHVRERTRELLVGMADARVVEALASWPEHPVHRADPTLLRDLRAAAGEPPPPSDAVRAGCAACRAALEGDGPEAQLRAAVYAAPRDPGPRAVYADRAAERGDAPDAGRLASVTEVEGRRYEGGLLVGAIATRDAGRLAGEPAWRTVRELGLAPWACGQRLLNSPHLATLEAVHFQGARPFAWGVDSLLARPEWVEVGVGNTYDVNRRARGRFSWREALELLPSVRRVGLLFHDVAGLEHGMGQLVDSETWERLEGLTLGIPLADPGSALRRWFRHYEPADRPLALTLVDSARTVLMGWPVGWRVRVAEGVLRATWHGAELAPGELPCQPVVHVLDAWPHDRLREVHVGAAPGVGERDRAALREALARHSEVAEVALP